MNISAMTLDEVRDKLAELGGWIYDAESHSWSKDGKETRWDRHPIDFTLDEAAKLPDGWEWARWGDGVWMAQPPGTNPKLIEILDTGDEKADMFRLRLACELAEKEGR